MRIKKGSKKYRKILSENTETFISPNILRFGEITDIIIDCDSSMVLNSQWTFSFLKNDVRTFIFKFYNNILGINTRVAHFVRNHPRTCTFCDIGRVPEEFEENMSHLFFDCRYVENLIQNFYGWLLNEVPSKREFFNRFNTINVAKNKVLNIVNILVKKYIWDCKIRFCIPNSNELRQNFCTDFNIIINQSRNVKKLARASGIFNNLNEIRF
jgi:hypothetical protein